MQWTAKELHDKIAHLDAQVNGFIGRCLNDPENEPKELRIAEKFFEGCFLMMQSLLKDMNHMYPEVNQLIQDEALQENETLLDHREIDKDNNWFRKD